MVDQVIVLGIDGLDPLKVEKWAPEIRQDVTGKLSLNSLKSHITRTKYGRR